MPPSPQDSDHSPAAPGSPSLSASGIEPGGDATGARESAPRSVPGPGPPVEVEGLRMLGRDAAICPFVGLNRIGVNSVLSEVFFGGMQNSGGQIPMKLSKPPYELVIVHSRAIPGGINYLTLSAKGCRLFGFPDERSKPLGSSALDQPVGISYFGVLDGPRRYRVERDELGAELGVDTPGYNVAHVVSDELGHPAIFRAYQTSNPRGAVQYVRGHLERDLAKPKLGKWIRSGHYGWALLGATPDAVRVLNAEVDRSGLRDEISVIVGLGPTAETLASVLRARRKGKLR